MDSNIFLDSQLRENPHISRRGPHSPHVGYRPKRAVACGKWQVTSKNNKPPASRGELFAGWPESRVVKTC